LWYSPRPLEGRMSTAPGEPAPASASEVTRLLQAWGSGDQDALQQLLPFVYSELHRLAHYYMAAEPNIALDLIGAWSARLTTEARIVYSRAVGVWERFGGNYAKVIPQRFLSRRNRECCHLAVGRSMAWGLFTSSSRRSPGLEGTTR
jgi:hypothetical protein